MKIEKIVIFDVCGTLYYSNTTFEFLHFLYDRNKLFNLFTLLRKSIPIRALNMLILRVFKFDAVRYFALKFLSSMTLENANQKTDEFVRSLSSKKILKMHDLLSTYKTEPGTKVILMSASLDIIIEKIAQHLDVQNFYASKLEFNGLKCKGRISIDLYGKKSELIKNIIVEGIPVVFITDNFNDYPVKSLVDDFKVISFQKDLKFWKGKVDQLNLYEK